MRTSAIVYVSVFVILLQVLILTVITEQNSYSDGIKRSLDSSLEMTVGSLREGADQKLEFNKDATGTDYAYSIQDSDVTEITGNWGSLSEFKKDFIKILVSNISTRIDSLDVDIYGADDINGLLSVKVTAHYKYLNNTDATVSSYKTVILNSETTRN